METKKTASNDRARPTGAAGVPTRGPAQGPAPSVTSPVAGYAAGAAVVAGTIGYLMRQKGLEKEGQIDKLKEQIRTERSKEKVSQLSIEQEKLTSSQGPILAGGTSLFVLAFGFAFMAGLIGLVRVRPRYAAGIALGLPLLFCALYSVYIAGITSMVISSLLGVALIYYVTGEPDPRKAREVLAFRKFPARREVMPELTPGYRYSAVMDQVMQLEQQKLLKQVPSLPPALERILPVVGEGQPVAYLQLKRNLGYVAFVQADDHNVSDYVSVVLALEDSVTPFVARPLPVVDGARVPNTGLKLADDPEFTASYLVEVDPRRDARDVRAFLSPLVREELLSLPVIWLHAQGNTMALTIFGSYDADLLDHLVDVADVIFAEYGADDGPSLLDPDDAEVLGGSKITKKKKKKPSVSRPAGAVT